MARFGDLDRYFDPGLTLADVPGRDGQLREYVIPLPSAELGLWCERVAQAGGQIRAASTEEEVQAAVDRVNALPEMEGDLTLSERTLGTVHAEMAADGVSHTHIQFCGATAYAWIVGGEEAAERYWKSGGRPESVARGNRAERRANTRTTNTAEASGATPPGSTSGTSSRQRSRKRGGASGSRGRRS